MDILLVMCVGVLISNRFFPEKYKRFNAKLQVVCTVLLIFCMGVTLGSRENFLQELGSLGWTSFLFYLIPAGFSLILVYGLTRKFMTSKSEKQKDSSEADR
ncbi:MAG: hypothetical protein ACLRPV_12065 [Lacrimispora saccharolytica]